MNEIAIKVENLSKTYKLYDQPMDRLKESLHPLRKKYHKDFYAVKDVSFEVKKGETVGIIGKNGSGKSTLLKMITGVLTPTSGSIQVNGKISALLELGAGFNPEYTGMENIYLNGTIMGYTKEEMDQRVQAILDFADIGEFVYQPVKTYSSGMFVRLAFAVAINVEPDILIVDEALSVGDDLFQRKCYAKIEEYKKSGKTILFVSHAGGMVIELCDRTLLLDDGEQLILGESNRVVNLYHKLLFAPTDKKNDLKDEIITLGQRLKTNMNIEVKKNVQNQQQKFSSVNEYQDINDIAEINKTEEFFDEGLIKTNSIEYENHGANITQFEIVNLQGQKVNVINSNKKYIWRYHVKFSKSFVSVRCGMLIKTASGFELGGAVTAKVGEGIAQITEGDELIVEFEFSPRLAPGVYFLNCGVLAIENDNEIYIDRKVDIAAFKILMSKNSTMTALVDFGGIPSVYLK